MSDVRSAVEWVFADILSYFAFLDFKRNLKIGCSPIGTMYSVCGLLTNALTCFYGSTTSSYFELQPPAIQEYSQFFFIATHRKKEILLTKQLLTLPM